MANFKVTHRGPDGFPVDSIVLDVATPRVACERAAEWLKSRFPDILAGQVTLIPPIVQLSEREAFAHVGIPERRGSL